MAGTGEFDWFRAESAEDAEKSPLRPLRSLRETRHCEERSDEAIQGGATGAFRPALYLQRQLGLVHAKAQSRKERREGVALAALPLAILPAR